MIEGMTVRNLSPYTQRNYLFAVSRFARHVRISPAEVGPEQLRDYLNHLVERKVSSSYFNVNVAALRFLYRDRRKIGGQAAIAIGAYGSLAGWNFCPKPEPSVPL